MLNQNEYMAMDAIDLGAGLKKKDFSCVELTQCAIERANEVNPQIHAIVSENYDNALKRAEEIDQDTTLLNQSEVAGIPFLIKDLSPVKGILCQYGSKIFENQIAHKNANIVNRYLDAGLNIFGKSSTPEFGVTLTTEPAAYDTCRNPWNIDYSTGGSSGGAAAAVAAGISPVANATDGGGSIRIPASCCGLFGLKPSRGLSSIENDLSSCWSGLSIGHVVSQTVRDSAAFLDIIRLDKPNLFPLPICTDSFTKNLDLSPEKLKIGVQLEHPVGEAIDQECLDAVNKALDICKTLGHEIEIVGFPIDYKAATSSASRIINTHTYQSVANRLAELGMDIDDSPLEASTKIMAKSGRKTDATTYLAARDHLKDCERTLASFYEDYDVIISPVLSKTPAPLGWLDMNSSDMREYSQKFGQYSGFVAIYNQSGQPSMSMPLHLSADGLPVGVLFSASWGDDELLLRLARQIEQHSPWPRNAGYSPSNP